MKKATLVWIIVAASLLVAGCIILVGVMTVFNWDFKKLSTSKYETNSYDITEKYQNISVITDTADVVFLPSEDGKTTVVCYENKKEKHSVNVVDGTLVIDSVGNKKWYDHIQIGINFASPKITVYMPSGEYGELVMKTSTGAVEIPSDFKFWRVDILGSTGNITSRASVAGALKIKLSTGDISLANLSAGSIDLEVSTGHVSLANVASFGELELEVSTGKAKLTDVTCTTLSTEGDTGDIILKNVVATEKFFIERGTGYVKFDGCDAAEIFVETDTGDVEGTLLSGKVFMARSDTGKVDVPRTATGGICEIETDTGNIKITIK